MERFDEEGKTYENPIGEPNENGVNESKSSQFPWANMANKGLAYNIETKGGEPGAYGWCCHYPHQLALIPHPLPQR